MNTKMSFKTKQKLDKLRGQLKFHEEMGNKGMWDIVFARLEKETTKELDRQKKAGKKFISHNDIDSLIENIIADEAAN